MEPRNQPDDAIDSTLAALRNATPPEGMEARIAQRLQHHELAPPADAFHWRDLLTGTALATAWWRGALSGAVAAAILLCAALLIQYGLHSPAPQLAVATATPQGVPVHFVRAETPTAPCASTPRLAARRSQPQPPAPPLHRATIEPAHLVLDTGLTAQERALVRFAQTADPKALAALNPENQVKLEAENAAQFEKFFTPPPAPLPPTQPQVEPPAQPAQFDQHSPTASANPQIAPQAEPANPNTETAPKVTK